MAKQYNLFISHSWAYGDAFDKLLALLRQDETFHFRDYSVPKNDPIHDAPNKNQLYAAIQQQISPSSVVLILAGVYATYSEWINKEIQISTTEFETPKPIIAIEPWGAEKTSAVVKQAADMIVKWNSKSIIAAVRKLCD